MKRSTNRWLIAVAILGVAAAAGYAMRPQSTPTVKPALATATGEMKAPVPPPLSAEERQRLLSDPRVQAYESLVAFQKRARSFFADAKNLTPVQRDAQADVLRQQIEPRAAAGQLSAGEAMLLEVGLIKATVSDEREQARLAKQVADRYRLRSQQREREWAARPTPQLDAYKVREQQIVREVMALPQIPGGLSRDEYLRQRLQQTREQIFVSHE